jgi:hypothetical protein
VPNSPQGVTALGAAGLASQATVALLGQGVTDPGQLARGVGFALVENYHAAVAAPACFTATQGFFAHF